MEGRDPNSKKGVQRKMMDFSKWRRTDESSFSGTRAGGLTQCHRARETHSGRLIRIRRTGIPKLYQRICSGRPSTASDLLKHILERVLLVWLKRSYCIEIFALMLMNIYIS